MAFIAHPMNLGKLASIPGNYQSLQCTDWLTDPLTGVGANKWVCCCWIYTILAHHNMWRAPVLANEIEMKYWKVSPSSVASCSSMSSSLPNTLGSSLLYSLIFHHEHCKLQIYRATLTRQHRVRWKCISHTPSLAHHLGRYPVDNKGWWERWSHVWWWCDGTSYGHWWPPLKMSHYERLFWWNWLEEDVNNICLEE